ncbi:MAG: hypothetical protein ACHREM_11385 [Polyangiales bacterium]
MVEPWTADEQSQIADQYLRRGWAQCPDEKAVLKSRPYDRLTDSGAVYFECRSCGRAGDVKLRA